MKIKTLVAMLFLSAGATTVARAVYDANTEMWELGGIYFSRYLGLDANGFYNPNPLLYPDFIAAQNGLAISSLVEGQQELFISWHRKTGSW